MSSVSSTNTTTDRPTNEARRNGEQRTGEQRNGEPPRNGERSRRSFEPFDNMLEVVPWFDPDLDPVGHDPRSDYVERFWLGLLGPSTTWLVRRFARGLADHPTGIRVNLTETSLALGLGDSVSRNSSLQRSLLRACQFGLAERIGDNRIALRLAIPPLSKRQVERLPESVRRAHEQWQRQQRQAAS